MQNDPMKIYHDYENNNYDHHFNPHYDDNSDGNNDDADDDYLAEKDGYKESRAGWIGGWGQQEGYLVAEVTMTSLATVMVTIIATLVWG